MFMWMVFVRLSLLPSSRNQKKENISSEKGRFWAFICIFALSFDTISTINNSKPKKSIGYEHIEKAIWWAKNY